MALSKEELLKPRYKVIADYPGSPFRVGAIMIFIKDFMHRTDGTSESTTHSDVFKSGNAIIRSEDYADGIHLYPHLFRKLEWWEEREADQMPEYISLNPENTTGGPEVFKVLAAKKDESGRLGINHTFPADENNPFDDFVDVKYFLPATEEEYNAYIKKQTTNV